MKNLKKRLPVLILAFLIAVMPLAMTVPGYASSDILDGVSAENPASFSFDGLSLPFPSFLTSSDSFFVFKESDGFYRLAVCSYSFKQFKPTASGVDVYLVNSGNFTVYKFDGVAWVFSFEQKAEALSLGCLVFGVYNVDSYKIVTNDYTSSRFIGQLVYSPPFSVSLPGVLSVFSGVSAWLAGAVNNMIPMFWTADVGLTPIGVLTVCSLALALILLLFWLIAGWLKFK